MSDDKEIEATRAAYAAIKGLDRAQWTRTLKYLATRMAEDDRASYIGNEFSGADVLPPISYCVGGNIQECCETPEVALLETDDPAFKVTAVNGVATVSQRFAVVLPGDDYDIRWFDARDDAEDYLKAIRS